MLKGFTLIELVLSIAISAILLAVMGPLLGQGLVSLQRGHELWNIGWQNQLGDNFLGRDIMGAVSLSTASSSQLTFMDDGNNTISYQLSGTTLTRQLNSGTAQVLVDNVSALTFSYWDQNNATTATLANIRCVQVAMTITDGLASTDFDSTWCRRAV